MVNFEQKFAFIIYLVSVIMSMTSKFNVLMWFGETKMFFFKIQKFPRKSGSKNSYSSHLGFQLSIPPNFVNVIAADLTVSKDIIPEELHRFLSYVISSNPDTECEKTKRLILFIGQDLCHSLTNSEWKLPKHILLCMTIRHIWQNITKSDMDFPEVRTLPTTTKTKERSLQSTVQPHLPPFHISKWTGPVMPDGASAPTPANEEWWQLALHTYHIWILCRHFCCSGKQIFPALGGFISATGKPPKRKSTIDYYPSINEPITEYSTVKELLWMSEEATR